jgi:hypothetical protein
MNTQEIEQAQGHFCECCERKLNPAKIVWLELDQRDDTYHNFADVPEDRSQGWFPFGPDCAKKKIKEARAART